MLQSLLHIILEKMKCVKNKIAFLNIPSHSKAVHHAEKAVHQN
jgi:hypothetical protein